MEPMKEDEREMLLNLLKFRAALADDLKAFEFIEKNSSSINPFSGVFVPQSTAPVYPIKGRFFFKQEADMIKGSVGGTDTSAGTELSGTIKTEVTKKGTVNYYFDMRIHWPNQDYTTLGVVKGQDGGMDENRKGQFKNGTLRFPFYHSTFQSAAKTYENSSASSESLRKLQFPDTKNVVLRKILSNLSYIEKYFKNIHLDELGHNFGITGTKAMELAYCAIKAGVLSASINQMDKHVYFTTRVGNKSREMFTEMQDLVVSLQQ